MRGWSCRSSRHHCNVIEHWWYQLNTDVFGMQAIAPPPPPPDLPLDPTPLRPGSSQQLGFMSAVVLVCTWLRVFLIFVQAMFGWVGSHTSGLFADGMQLIDDADSAGERSIEDKYSGHSSECPLLQHPLVHSAAVQGLAKAVVA